MRVITTQATTPNDTAAVLYIRQQVFEKELGITVDLLCPPQNGHITYLLARVTPNSEPVGCVSVVDTSGQHELHESLGLRFEPDALVARFTHLAVLKPFRGMNIPLAMMIEAHRSVIVPGDFDYTWLLFDVEKAPNSFLSRQLGFTLLPQTFVSEYGCRCPLVRNERTPAAARAIRQADSYLKRCNVEMPFAISA